MPQPSATLPESGSGRRRVLLVVDDTPVVARGLERCLRRHFDAIYLANSPVEAEAILARAPEPPTHMICDYYFANDARRGTELVPAWRAAFACLQVAVILSGSQIHDLEPVPGVDAIFKKPTELDALIDYLSRPKPYDVV